MHHGLSLAYAYACLVLLVSGQAELPTGIKTCKRNSDDFTSCLRLAIQESWPLFVKGIPEIDFPSLDPFVVEHQDNSFENGELHAKVSLTNLITYGMVQAQFLSVKPEFGEDNFKLTIDLRIPKLFIETDYKAEGALGSFKIGGKGYANISLEDIQVNWKIEGRLENDKWMVEHFYIYPQVGKCKLWATDVVNGNKELNRIILDFANEYWPIIYRGMRPYITNIYDPYFTDLANRFFSKVPFSKVFP